MSRPELTQVNKTVSITIPPGWFTTVNAITRQPYNQLATVAYEIEGDSYEKFLANEYNKPNRTMRDTITTSDVVPIIPQEETVKIDLNFYYSKISGVRTTALEDDKYASAKLDFLITDKPSNAPKDFPDYRTFFILVEDGSHPEDTPGQPEYDDLICTVNCIQVSAPPPPSKPKYNLANIQGDILPAFPKALEYFYYFRITDLDFFRKVFKDFILPNIRTADQLVNGVVPEFNPGKPETFLNHFVCLNVGFSYLGLKLFGLGDGLGDEPFEKGQQYDSRSLGDAGTLRGDFWTPDWDGVFKVDIHGIFLITAYNNEDASAFIKELDKKLLVTPNRPCIKTVYLLHGSPRDGDQGPNDHFGYRGGMSNPQVAGVTFKDRMKFLGSPLIPIGVIVMGYDGDEDKDKRPAWAKDGAFMVTRKLNNSVPEFDAFLAEHGPKVFPNIPPKDAALRLGARLFGRWKNGTPVELSPDNDNPDIAKDPDQINNFVFDQSKQQIRCPFASHMRKSNPRNDVSPVESAFRHFIRRHNMPYGEEVTDEERDGRGTIKERGLHVVCYQSSIVRGFKFIQEGWYNDPNFPPNKPVQPGFDPIFGQTGKEDQSVHRFMTGTNPSYEQQLMNFPHKFIDVRGGEYFFSPSISTMRSYIAAK